MAFHPFEITIPHIAYICLGGFTVVFGMFSLLLREKLYIGEACWAFLFGVVIGPYGANIFDPRGWGGDNAEEVTNAITLEFTRVVLAIGVFAIGVELPKAYMAKHWKSLLFLLGPVMTWGWFVSAGLIFALIPGLNFLSSLVVAACLTPTDPILAAAVVGGKYADKHVPAHIRHLLAAESGCNDGAAYPFLFIALYLILDAPHTGMAVKDWFLQLWLYQIILGIVLGSLIGLGFRYLMKFCERKELIDRHSYVAQYVSLALLTIGITTLLGSDDLLAAFCCGTAFAWDGFFNRQTEESVFSSVIDLLFNVAAFVYVGAWMPFAQFQDEALTLSVWRLIVIAILVLLLRRLPIFLALYRWIPDVKTFREAVFSGHFGPIGVGAVFISTLAKEKLGHHDGPPENQTQLLAASIQPIVAFMVLCSITIHGLSIPSFSLGRRVHSVSRTWSSHARPDWTTQARHVQLGDDIVINRDSVMERGEVKPNEKLEQEEDTRTTTNGNDDDKREEESGEQTMIESSQELEGRAKAENMPDGTDAVLEWKEGNHKVIERRTGPGEEVEVEVVRNAFAPGDEEQTTSAFRGNQPTVRRIVAAHIDKLMNAPHEIETEVDESKDRVGENIQKVEHKAKRAIASSSSFDEEDEEGWASDHSAREGSTVQSTEIGSDGKKRSKPSKKKPVIKTIPFGKGRRRNSMRRGLLGQVHQVMEHKVQSPSQPPTQSHGSSAIESSDTEEEDSVRGRRSIMIHEPYTPSRPRTAESSRSGTAPSSRPGTAKSSIKNLRADLIRAGARSRDESPSRSIRFADEDRPGSGASTPTARQSLLSGNATAPFSTSHERSPSDDPDSGARVTFDIPGEGA